MFLLPILVLSSARLQGEPNVITVHADRPSHPISRDLFGVFFEEINHAGDGGLNAELVRNFNFHEPLRDNQLPGWTVVGNGTAGTVLTGYGEVDVQRATPGDALVGASNGGYWGIPVTAGSKYRFALSCQRRAGTPIVLRLVDANGRVCGSATAVPSEAFSIVKGTIASNRTEKSARLEFGITAAGAAALKSVSLQPLTTWKGHGLRPDLASMVDELRPAFVRFPGGCYVEGGAHLKDRFKWDTTSTCSGARTWERRLSSSSIAGSRTRTRSRSRSSARTSLTPWTRSNTRWAPPTAGSAPCVPDAAIRHRFRLSTLKSATRTAKGGQPEAPRPNTRSTTKILPTRSSPSIRNSPSSPTRAGPQMRSWSTTTITIRRAGFGETSESTTTLPAPGQR